MQRRGDSSPGDHRQPDRRLEDQASRHRGRQCLQRPDRSRGSPHPDLGFRPPYRGHDFGEEWRGSSHCSRGCSPRPSRPSRSLAGQQACGLWNHSAQRRSNSLRVPDRGGAGGAGDFIRADFGLLGDVKMKFA